MSGRLKTKDFDKTAKEIEKSLASLKQSINTLLDRDASTSMLQLQKNKSKRLQIVESYVGKI